MVCMVMASTMVDVDDEDVDDEDGNGEEKSR
jgi:hypothetical protein